MTNEKTGAITELINNSVNRREFGKRAVATGLWAAVGAATLGLPSDANAQSITDVDILNFALNLEYLEAEFYTVATTGRRIEDVGIGVTGLGTLGGTVGGSVVAMDNRIMQLARDIANEEQMHVKLLRTALGSAAVAKPAINLAA
ncbi:MAG TPA: ferritin-like domain-containing protein, partial [Vicinamibacterales bacterium]|nr:ferritin-like domain-containing protein [Vicinamibacterales bacterium]